MEGLVHQIAVSRGGVPKLPVAVAVHIHEPGETGARIEVAS